MEGAGHPSSPRCWLTLRFQAAQTFPLKFQSPLARLSVKITNRIRWNLGYQYYGYREDFFKGQPFTTDYGYRAQTGYTSVLWSF